MHAIQIIYFGRVSGKGNSSPEFLSLHLGIDGEILSRYARGEVVSRARKHIAEGRLTPASSGEQRRFLKAFIVAAQKGDLDVREDLFTEDVVSYSDGGGVVRAARVLIVGRERVAKFIASFSSHFWSGVTLSWTEVNGQEAVLISRYGEPVGLVTTDASEQRYPSDHVGYETKQARCNFAAQTRHCATTAHWLGNNKTPHRIIDGIDQFYQHVR